MEDRFFFEDLGEAILITTELRERGCLSIAVAWEEYDFSNKHVFRSASGMYFTRVRYTADGRPPAWGDWHEISQEDYPELACVVRDCFTCISRFICQSEEERL